MYVEPITEIMPRKPIGKAVLETLDRIKQNRENRPNTSNISFLAESMVNQTKVTIGRGINFITGVVISMRREVGCVMVEVETNHDHALMSDRYTFSVPV